MQSKIDYKDVGIRIRKYRKRTGITQTALAELVGCEPTTISHIERGTSKVSLPLLVNIVNELGVSLDLIILSSIKANEHILKEEIEDMLKNLSKEKLEKIAIVVESIKKIL